MPGTFPATYFTFTTKYPETGSRIRLGNSWEFTSGPTAPDQRVFTLTLSGMRYYLLSNGTLDAITQPELNMKVLEDFYLSNKLHKTFTFNHPVYGALICKFNRPLEIPKGIQGGNGLLEDFDVELIEQP